jgi:putative aminopeptidase FrvX
MTVVVDVSTLRPPGNGPLIYTSSGYRQFPEAELAIVNKIIKEHGFSHEFLNGAHNDSANFAEIPGAGVVAVEVPVLNMHSPYETAKTSDITQAVGIVEAIVKNVNLFLKKENK